MTDIVAVYRVHGDSSHVYDGLHPFNAMLFSPLFYMSIVGPVVDLSAQGLQKLEPSFSCSEDTHTLILDRNHIMKLDHLERSPGLQQVL